MWVLSTDRLPAVSAAPIRISKDGGARSSRGLEPQAQLGNQIGWLVRIVRAAARRSALGALGRLPGSQHRLARQARRSLFPFLRFAETTNTVLRATSSAKKGHYWGSSRVLFMVCDAP